MKLYQLTIRPLSPFGTPLKGDTIFGHVCWQTAYDSDLLNGSLDEWIKKYDHDPFIVCSSAFPLLEDGESGQSIAFPRPQLPSRFLTDFPAGSRRCERMKTQKELKEKKWMLVGEDLQVQIGSQSLMSDKELFSRYCAGLPDHLRYRLSGGKEQRLFLENHQAHNSIDRLTGTTGSGDGFAPYTCENIAWCPGVQLAVLVLVDEAAMGEKQLRTIFARIGQWGFGRDAGTGLGRFELTGCRERLFPEVKGASACFTLSPSVPQTGKYRQQYFSPFTRFGRHGDRLAHSKNPFKAPVIMADEGAVFVPRDHEIFSRPYLGRAVHDVSLAQPNAVVQGYSLYLPCEVAI
ncbi:MAG: hypothetical protein BZ151_08070 [Desulfobacca sp. 4484_104]|nr:MAG: hypothetical protein BZ151_08070 [Desulfobacca sp. 4484_104]